MSYKQNTSSNRDALFGSAGASSSKGSKKKSKSSASGPPSSSSSSSRPTSTGYKYGSSSSNDKTTTATTTRTIGLTGDAKVAKMKEAKDYHEKAKKAMQKGLFSSQDPLAGATFYKRAADTYQKCGEPKLERMGRISSADCQFQVGAWATAAAEYTRAAELYEKAEDETIEIKQEIGKKLYLQAADAWRNMNEPAKAASAQVQAALALAWGDDSLVLPKLALQGLEEAIEAHVPDPMNPYARYRQTGISSYINPDTEETVENPSEETLALAQQQIVSRPYAHESVQEVLYLMVSFGEYPSALYAAGAASTLLSHDGVSTLALSRAFIAETILSLAMGDPIAAEENFLKIHVQKSSYLSSRECKLAEELFRAVKNRDSDALDEARDRKGSNRAGLANLHESIRELVTMLRVNGVARKGAKNDSKKSSKSKKSQGDRKGTKSSSTNSSNKGNGEPQQSLAELAAQKTGYEKEESEAQNIDTFALQDELDALDFGDDDDSDSDLSDDEVDLR